MRESDIVLIDLIQSDGSYKLRPALILKRLPKYNDFLVCGISTQLHQYIEGLDEVLNKENNNFAATGLHQTSIIRLSFLAVIPSKNIPGVIGKIDYTLHKELLQRLANFLVS